MSLLSGSWTGTGLRVHAPADGEAGAWRVWLRGRPEGWQRLAGEHDLGDPGSLPAAHVLALLCERVGPDRALPQLEGHWHAILAEGSNTLLVRSRVGMGGWFWTQGADGLEFAEHPARLPHRGPLALDRLVEEIRGETAGGVATPWPQAQRLPAGHILPLAPSQPVQARRWWDPGTPPAGRAGNRTVWDRSALQVLVLGLTRATRHEAWVHLRAEGPEDAFVQQHASTAPFAQQAGRLDEAGLRALAAALPGPGLHAEARRALPALLAAPVGRPCVTGVGPGPLLGAGFGARSGPGHWRSYATDSLPDRVLAPLHALAQARGVDLIPALCHPAVLPVLGQVPWRHLRGLRGSMAQRLDLLPPRDEPWAPYLAGEGAELLHRLGRENEDLGPIPKDAAAAARYLVVALWRQAQGDWISGP